MKTTKKFYETADFKKLNQEWQRKLKQSGFKDIETQESIDQNYVISQEFDVRKSWIAYNNECIVYLQSGAITDPLDVFIFEKHCEGVSNRAIEVELANQTVLPAIKHSAIDVRLAKILKSAKIKAIDFSHV